MTSQNTNNLSEARTAEQFLAEFRSDPENDRLYHESEISLDVTERLKAIRKSCGLRQSDLARRVGCSQSFIAKLEGGGYERLGLGSLRTYVRAMAYDVAVASMFVAIAEPVYNGRSSQEMQPAFTLQEIFAGRLASLPIKTWEKADGVDRGRTKLSVVPEAKDIGAAA